MFRPILMSCHQTVFTACAFFQPVLCQQFSPLSLRLRIALRKEREARSNSLSLSLFISSLSYSKNGVIRIDGFSLPDQYDEEALSLWAPDAYEENNLELETSKYILSYIGDKFCQLVMTENTAATWIKKDGALS